MSAFTFRPYLAYNVAVGATSAQSQAVSPMVLALRLISNTNCWVKFGTNPTADKTTSTYLQAGVAEYFHVDAGGSLLVAVIEDSAPGTLNITEMTR